MYKNFFKRLIDIFFAVFLILILFFPGLVVALSVILSSRGPIFFKQIRFKKDSKPFKIFKFRTMLMESPQLANKDFSNISQYYSPIGGFLRATSLDEIPQLWNVLMGDMSFVGPRPLANTDRFVLELRKLNGADQVRPGITGLAQISGRNNISDAEKAAFDSKYAKSVSFFLDLKIIMLTLFNVLKRAGINAERNAGNR
jgi:O-antigen biosynthesis protein WbqP